MEEAALWVFFSEREEHSSGKVSGRKLSSATLTLKTLVHQLLLSKSGPLASAHSFSINLNFIGNRTSCLANPVVHPIVAHFFCSPYSPVSVISENRSLFLTHTNYFQNILKLPKSFFLYFICFHSCHFVLKIKQYLVQIQLFS